MGSLTDVLCNTVSVLAPFRETLDQVPQHRWHTIDGLGVIVEENLSRRLVLRSRYQV